MNTIFSSVTSITGGGVRRPKICFCGSWLPEAGFNPDALVQAIPEKNGMKFTLYDENIEKYSDLLRITKESNGKLIPVSLLKYKGVTYPSINTTGNYICSGGLAIGDTLVVRSCDGVIEAKKLDVMNLGIKGADKAKALIVGSVREKGSGIRVAKINLRSEWLYGTGFTKNRLVIASYKPGVITLKLQNENIKQYSELVKYARKHNAKLLQVSEYPNHGKPVPYISVSGSFLYNAGFFKGNVYLAFYEYGLIRLIRLSYRALGFGS